MTMCDGKKKYWPLFQHKFKYQPMTTPNYFHFNKKCFKIEIRILTWKSSTGLTMTDCVSMWKWYWDPISNSPETLTRSASSKINHLMFNNLIQIYCKLYSITYWQIKLMPKPNVYSSSNIGKSYNIISIDAFSQQILIFKKFQELDIYQLSLNTLSSMEPSKYLQFSLAYTYLIFF